MELSSLVARIKQSLTSRRYTSEADVREAVVLPVLRALGWDDLDPDRVKREYALEGRRVDYALSAHGAKPDLFIEVKGPGYSAGGERQLFEYAFHAGIPFAILTNGQEWSFFLPTGAGAYDERLLYKLDLAEREPSEAVERLVRYLGFERVRSRDALKDARRDYDDLHTVRIVRDTLPQAWAQLLDEPDDALVNLVAERATTLCGFPADRDLVAAFLGSIRAPEPRRDFAGLAAAGTRRSRTTPPAPSPRPAAHAGAGSRPVGSPAILDPAPQPALRPTAGQAEGGGVIAAEDAGAGGPSPTMSPRGPSATPSAAARRRRPLAPDLPGISAGARTAGEPSEPLSPQRPAREGRLHQEQPRDERPRTESGALPYRFLGQEQTARSGNHALLHVLRSLAGRDSSFLERFAPQARGKQRNHVAPRAEDVYPGRPQLLRHVVELAPGWYIGTNISNRDKVRLLRTACDVAGLRFGVDLVIDLPNANV